MRAARRGNDGPSTSHNQPLTTVSDRGDVVTVTGDPRGQGCLSTRALASVLGMSASTVARDAREAAPGPRIVMGLDGKRYPVNLDNDWRTYLADRVHRLRCQDGMTYREIVAAVVADGEPISLGTVRKYLRRWECDVCSPVSSGTPEQNPDAEPVDLDALVRDLDAMTFSGAR